MEENEALVTALLASNPNWKRGIWQYGNLGNVKKVTDAKECENLCQEHNEECTHWNYYVRKKECALRANTWQNPGYHEDVNWSVTGLGPASGERSDQDLAHHTRTGDERRRLKREGSKREL